MAARSALIDYNKCKPETCENGICKAAQACRYKLLSQENIYDVPMAFTDVCRGCGNCARIRPLHAVRIENN
jgi:translation initiation factor RLI1